MNLIKLLYLKSLPILVFLIGFSAYSQTKLIMIGGGTRPPEVLQLFGNWSKAENGRILVIAWAAEDQDYVGYARAAANDLASVYNGAIDFALAPPTTTSQHAFFVQQLRKATGIFFTGGDQNLILDVFKTSEGQATKNELIKTFLREIPFAGTSAGTAIMSTYAIGGNPIHGKVPIIQGLGLLDLESHRVIIDQHFSQRDRAARLQEALIQTGIEYGLGVDEATAVVKVGPRMSVMGINSAHFFTKDTRTNLFNEQIFAPGDSFEISK